MSQTAPCEGASAESHPRASIWRRVRPTLLLALALATIATVLLPGSIYLANQREFALAPADYLPTLASAFGLVLAGLALLGALSIALLRERGVALMLGLSLCLIAQGLLFVWDYGSFDGAAIDWDAHDVAGIAEVIVWMAILAAALLWPHRLYAEATWVAALLLVALLAGSVFQWGSAVAERESTPLGGSTPLGSEQQALASLTAFSRESNILVFVLDMFQSDLFAEAIQDPSLAARMPPGFTYYRNAVSVYPSTRLSLQSILTSRALPDSTPLEAWQREQMATGVPTLLQQWSYGVAVVSISPQHLSCRDRGSKYLCVLLSRLESASQQLGLVTKSQQARAEASTLLGISLFRLAPHFVKPRIYDQGELLRPGLADEHDGQPGRRLPRSAREDLSFMRALTAHASPDAQKPVFRFFHLNGPHLPHVTDAHCNRAPGAGWRRDASAAEQRERAVLAAKCSLSTLFDLLWRLDEIGAYDASLVFVLGDHGQLSVPLDLSLASLGPEPPSAPPVGDERGLGSLQRGVPVFLAKRMGERHALRIDDRPVSLCDVPNSILDELGRAERYGCESIFSSAERRRTPRLHYRYKEAGKKRGGVYRFTEYGVEGHSWLSSSWIRHPEAAGNSPGVAEGRAGH